MKTVYFSDHVEAIPEESSHHGRKSAPNRGVSDSPKEPGAYRRASQGDYQPDVPGMTELMSPDSDLSGGISRLERARIAREKFEADRQRRLEQLKEARRQAEVFREQQMLLKKKRIEEARVRDVERRKSVEDRRKKLEEIEKMRRDTIQRKLERVERVNDTRRGTAGPSGARIFGFGSCTPREICTPIRQTYSSLPVQNGSKSVRDPSKPSRTVISSPDVHWLSRQRDWSHRGPRTASAHATLMTGSFTVAMNSPLAIGLHPRNDTQHTEMNPLKKAASTTHLAKTGVTKRPSRIAPYPNDKDKLDRTVSTPNIASNNQRHRSRRAESGASSPTRSLERPRQSSAASRPRPSTSLGQPRSDPPPRRAISSLGVSSTPGNSSSGLFDRLSQPRRVQTRSEEVSPERKRNFASPVKSSSSGSGKPTAKKPLKSANGDENGAVPPKTSVVTFQIEQEDTPKSDDRASVEVNVEDVEADALNDVDSENTTENSPLAVKIEEEEVSDSLRNDTSAAATSLPTDRSASPPRTLQLSVEPVSNPAVALPARPSIQRPNSVNADVVNDIHPPTSALPPPSPSAMMNKGSAPSTPTGQRASSTREITEVEYKQRLAEQRRLARERKAAQEAEKARAREEERKAREAELQRLREAAEQQRLEEEEEQRRMEEEQRIREEEQRLIEEERKRLEELKRQQEEREREELERKEREEMELRQRQLEEERLAQQREEEEKRLERKKRLESIMSRVKKSTDTSGSRESLTSSHLDLSPASNGSETLEAERPVSPAPQFKSALLQSMLNKGKLSTSIRAVSALRRSQGYNGSSGSLIGDLQNLSRSSENLSTTSNSGPTVPSSSSGEMTTSQIEDQLSPPPVVNPAMWRSHPNGIPGLGGHERDLDQSHDFEDETVCSTRSLVENSIQSRLDDLPSTGKPAVAQERRKARPNSVHFDDVVSTSRSGTVSGDIVDDETASSDGDTQLVTHNTVSGQWLAEESHLPASMASREMADTMS